MVSLRVAATNGDLTGVIAALESGSSVDWVDEYGNTALCYAALRNRQEVVKLLITLGANVNLGNQGGWTPLMYASARGRTGLIRLLLDAGATPDTVLLDVGEESLPVGLSPLDLARDGGHTEAAALLAEAMSRIKKSEMDE